MDLKRIQPYILLTALLLAALLAVVQSGYGSALPADARADVFSAGRALKFVRELASQSRFPDTPEHLSAYSGLLRQLRGLGYQPETQNFVIPDTALKGQNLLARLEGSRGGDAAILLEAHYDTNPNMPGAADNASGVALVLEIARALKAGPAPNNDVIFLLTDAEELGVFGAEAFVSAHPWAKDVRVALNFDTFSSGAAFIWNTSPENGWLLEAYLQAAPWPMGVAWIDQLARMLPMDTDLSPFLRAGISGANFTSPFLPFEDHTPRDTPDIIEPTSLQHAGEQGLALARFLARQDLTTTRAPDRLYFNLAGPWMMAYGQLVAVLFGVLALLGGGWVIYTLIRRGPLTGWGVTQVGLFNLLLFLALPLLELALWLGVYLGLPGFSQNGLIWISVLLIGGLYLLAYLRLKRSTRLAERLLPALGLWGLLAVTSSWFNFLLSQPVTLIFLLASAAAASLMARARLGKWGTITAGISLAGVVFFLVPPVYLLLRSAGQVIIPAVVGAVVWVLGLLLVLPLFEWITERGGGGVPGSVYKIPPPPGDRKAARPAPGGSLRLWRRTRGPGRGGTR